MQSMMCVFFVKRPTVPPASSFDIQVEEGPDGTAVNLFRLMVDNGHLIATRMTVNDDPEMPDVLPVGRRVHCDVDPGIYWFGTANPFRVATTGDCYSLVKAGKDPWPVPPAAPEGPRELALFYANHRAVYDAEFGGIVSVGGDGVLHWTVITTEDANEVRCDLRGETPSLKAHRP